MSYQEKPDITNVEDIEDTGKASEPVHNVIVTEDDNKRIRRKTDKYLLSILVWVYFLQIYDKTVFGYGNTWGLSTDLNLVKKDYSLASSMTSIATLCWQPFSAYLIVRVNPRYLMTVNVFCWGASAACMAASNGRASLLATRFLLGLFEAANIPLFSMLTATWYRRAEQPLRVCAWFITNSAATIVAALVSYGFGHIVSPHWKAWQSIYLSAGIITVLTAPLVWFKMDADLSTARFWSDDYERDQAVERLRANQTGVGSRQFKWGHVAEMFMDPKSWLFAALICIPNIAAHVANTFGPTLIKGIGFDSKTATLLNIPFGALQAVGIAAGSYAAARWKIKSIMLLILCGLTLAGGVMMYVAESSTKRNTGLALTGYYFLAFSFGCSPVVYSWAIANVGGQTKKSTMLSFMNCATATGQLTGPLLMNAVDAPRYLPGIRSLMISQAVLVCCICAQVVNLYIFNKKKRAQRVASGQSADVVDTSMDRRFVQMAAAGTGHIEDLDKTDWKNDQFVYVY